MEYDKFDLDSRFLSGAPSLIAVFSKPEHFTDENILKIKTVDPIAEVRVDKLVDPTNYNVTEYLEALSDMPIILTNRRKEEGGDWELDESFRINNLLCYLDKVNAVDIEIESESAENVINIVQSAGKVAIASYHDFNEAETNDLSRLNTKLHEVTEKALEDLCADYVKIAVKVDSEEELAELTKFSCDMLYSPVSVIPMGKAAKAARIFFAVLNKKFTYCSIDNEEVAPGQVNLFEMDRYLYTLDANYFANLIYKLLAK